ncbi:MAG TPA: DUF5009 domain-containing protein [Thermoanaerobaculia bacterium]|nr:DUF5009 domain-containing protein [Thermoanaerobaculia bacterium]
MQSAAEPKRRLVSLDVFRGATVAAMLLVNDPGTWNAVYWPLEHAEWHGWTPTDLIFPFFLFIVGITTALSRKEPKGILRRGALIVLFGLLVNAFPFYWWGKIAGVADPTLLQRIAYRFEHLRFLGVLQRIGIVYAISALIAWRASAKQIAIIAAAILLGYWAIMAQGPLEPPEATMSARVDRAVIGENHIWSSTKTWDPEGPLSTLPAIATALAGILAAPYVKERRVRLLALAGLVGIVIGYAWHPFFPINKNLWTSSYVVFTAGCAMLLLASCIWLIDIKEVRGWTKPFVIYGTNPLVAFVGSGVMARLLLVIKIHGTSVWATSYAKWFEPYFEPHFGSLLWALLFVLFWLGVLSVLYRKGIFLRV